MGNATNIKRAALEAAPERKEWATESIYQSIYLLPEKKKHDSGFGLICIVGMKADGSLEKAAWCDDICWKHSGDDTYSMRSDMTFPGGIVHCWGWRTEFEVGYSLSSTDVKVKNTRITKNEL